MAAQNVVRGQVKISSLLPVHTVIQHKVNVRQIILLFFTGGCEFVRWQLLCEILHSIKSHVLIDLLIICLHNQVDSFLCNGSLLKSL